MPAAWHIIHHYSSYVPQRHIDGTIKWPAMQNTVRSPVQFRKAVFVVNISFETGTGQTDTHFKSYTVAPYVAQI